PSSRSVGKKEGFDAPVLGMFTRLMGAIRVERGTGSDEPLDKAIAALRAGEAIFLAPEGTIPRGPAFFAPGLKARWGPGRLAPATPAPVIPRGGGGTEKVWPRSHLPPRLDPRSRPVI